jgi:hypothetical protein
MYNLQSSLIFFWVARFHFDLGWPYSNMTLGCIYVKTDVLHCDKHLDVVTTLCTSSLEAIVGSYVWTFLLTCKKYNTHFQH